MIARIQKVYKILRQLGFTQVGLFALYKLGLKTGYFKRKPKSQLSNPILHFLFDFPSKEELLSVLGKDGLKNLITEADHIVAGKFRIFGGALVDLKLDLNHSLSHWADYEKGKAKIPSNEYQSLNTALNLPPETCDLKLLWEPARFGWAFTLGRAFHATDERKYVEAFWRYFELFDKANPVKMGPHWMNGQEVAIRLMALIWAAQAFWDARVSTNQQLGRLAESIAEHAERIPVTLLYARSQNNNHLTSEAAGLYTASLALPDHPDAEKWRKLGTKWLNWSFENQIDEKGEYIQHSVNYHRLALQLALWGCSLTTIPLRVQASTKGHEGKTKETLGASSCPSWLTEKAQQNLALATHWLAELTDPISGNAVNLGANDGAYIFPFANGDSRDVRPVVQAASQAFLNESPFDAGGWDEMTLWFQVSSAKRQVKNLRQLVTCNLRPTTDTWAHLRIADGNLRLAHADQLQIDLWWRGQNITLDPGTYLYNAKSPWNNPLPATEFHNTVTVNGQDQMTRASRFMYLDWSRGRVVEKSDERIVAEHDGYRKLGVTHRRTVSFAENIWRVEDDLIPNVQLPNTYRLHWLLQDGEWKMESSDGKVDVSLKTEQGLIKLSLHSSLITHYSSSLTLVRAGTLHGDAQIPPTRGWYSPTYGVKIPALSLALEVTADDAVQFITEFQFPTP